MAKYKILVIPSDRTGVSKFRSVDPHLRLQEMYPEDFWIDIDYDPKIEDDNFLKNYDLIHYHRGIGGDPNKSNQAIKRIRELGIPSIMDLDDFWLPNREHPAYSLVKQNNVAEMIKENLRNSQYITTTTPLFASEIAALNKNVFVMPNAINPKEKQFQNKHEECSRIRIGWLGGSSHEADLGILSGVPQKLELYKDKCQWVICGFDTRGVITMVDQATGKQKQRPITPKESVWWRYEKLFTQDHKHLDDDYVKYLMEFKEDKYDDYEKPYRRVWTRPITTYAENYNRFDISLAPLKEHLFNKVKSQLKVIEAGFHKKALIAQNFGPYTIDCISAVSYGGKINPKGNSLLVDSYKNHKQWYQHIKRLLENPNMISDLGEKLYETVQIYHMDKVTDDRAELYKELIKKG